MMGAEFWLNEIMTLQEAGERWGKTTDSLRQACISRNGKPPRFTKTEIRQSARTWLVTRAGDGKAIWQRKRWMRLTTLGVVQLWCNRC